MIQSSRYRVQQHIMEHKTQNTGEEIIRTGVGKDFMSECSASKRCSAGAGIEVSRGEGGFTEHYYSHRPNHISSTLTCSMEMAAAAASSSDAVYELSSCHKSSYYSL